MTIIKLIGGTLLTLVLLIALAILIVPRVIDPNDYRENIAAVVKDKTGRDLKLQGDLSISVFPWLGIRTQGLSLSQPPEIGGDMLTVQTAQLRVKLLPLFSKKFEIDTVILESPEVRLITLKNGVNSLSGLTGGVAGGEADLQNDDAKNAVVLVIQGLELTDGSLLWEDQQSGQRYEISELNLLTGNLIGEQMAAVDASGIFSDAAAPPPTLFELVGEARINSNSLEIYAQNLNANLKQGAQSVQLKIADLSIDQNQVLTTGTISLVAGSVLSGAVGEPQDAKVSAQLVGMDFNFTTGQLELFTTVAEIDVALQEQPSLQFKTSVPSLSFNTNSSVINAVKIGVQGQIGSRDLQVSVPKITANIASQSMNADSIELNSLDLTARLENLRLSKIFDMPTARGALRVQPFDAAKLLKDLEIDYTPADQDVLRNVGFESQFTAGTDKLSLTGLQLTLDQSRMTGSFAATDYANLDVEFDLKLDKLNLDQYLPAGSAEANTADGESISGAAALAVPMALLKNIQANGSFKAGQLISGGLQLDAVDVQIVSTPGQLSIIPKADLYDGKLGGTMVFSENGDKSELRVNNNVDLISLAKFLAAADVSDQLSGIGSLALDIVVTEQNGVQSNEGTIKLFAKEGAIKGVDIKNIVNNTYQAYSELRGKDIEQADETGDSEPSDETRFSELLGTFQLKDFKITNRDFQLKAPLFNIAGAGDIDLAQETIDYLVQVAITSSDERNDGEAWRKLNGLSIPIRFRGSLFAPAYSLDMKALYQGLAKKEIENKKSEYLQEKLGIEEGGKLSTSELLQQILINKADKKTQEKTAESETTDSSNYYPGHGDADQTTTSASEAAAPDAADPGAAAPGAAAPGAAAPGAAAP
ncbi:MAG: AsmA family protein, partial [Gammaproteobacteria bacterium]|nr:AsmA family protein [Gammaproteobacteria bacterium]